MFDEMTDDELRQARLEIVWRVNHADSQADRTMWKFVQYAVEGECAKRKI